MNHLTRLKSCFLLATLLVLGATSTGAAKGPALEHSWRILNTVPFKGKQDDISFSDPETGWYVNGKGFIYRTEDGGEHWAEQLHQPGTYFRALGVVDSKTILAGNIGPDYFPGVTDSNPLYQSWDGGASWGVVKAVTGEAITGVCSIDVLRTSFINAGQLDTRVTIHAAGRVGGPAAMATSRDGGKTWLTRDLTSVAGMILDVKFVDERTGFLCAASDPDIEKSHARIVKTTDGGKTWKVVYESTRPYETTWKCSFPSSRVGYATIQSYDPDPGNVERYVAKTTDGGETWSEVPLASGHDIREFGIGFADDLTGWVGALDGGWFTSDGGKHWSHEAMGTAVNKIRVISASRGGYVVYAIGVDVRKLDLRVARPEEHIWPE